MKLFLSLIIVISASLSFAQESQKNKSSEDNAASRLIKKKREKTRKTKTIKSIQIEEDKKPNE